MADMKALVEVGCWSLMAGVLTIGALYAWLMAEMLGVTRNDVLGTIRDAGAFGLLWFLYQRVRSRPAQSSSSPTISSTLYR